MIHGILNLNELFLMPKFNISTHFILKYNDQKRTGLLKYDNLQDFVILGGVSQSVTYFRGGGSEMCDKV